MISRTFKCDLCGTVFNPNEEDVAFGLYWNTDGLHVVREIRQLEHHICIKCYQAIRRAVLGKEWR